MQARVLRKRRFRFWQFSLRTLLVVTFLVAVACAYYLQPPSREELLAGGKLRLWRQVKLIEPGKTLPGTQVGLWGGGTNVTDVQLVNHGRWTLSDENGETISTGYYQDGAQAGRWITYHAGGKKAIEGRMSHDARVGVWKSWYASGQQQTETTFADEPRKRNFPKNPTGDYGLYSQYRDGLARGWHASGQPQFEGSYSSDQQEGVWIYYDANGRTLSRGPYRAGKRHGDWTLRDAEQPARMVRYIDGRTQEELQQHLAQLKKRAREPYGGFRGDDPAIDELASLGAPAVAVLLELLRSSHPHSTHRKSIPRALSRMGPQATAALPELRELAATLDAAEGLEVTAAIYAIDPAVREDLFKPLFAQAVREKPNRAFDIISTMYAADARHRPELFDHFMSYELDRSPSQSHSESRWIRNQIAQLDDDLVPHLKRHIMSTDPRVRERVAQVLIVLRERMVSQRELKTSWEDCRPLIERLQSDMDPSVQAAAKVKPRSGGMGGVSAGFF